MGRVFDRACDEYCDHQLRQGQVIHAVRDGGVFGVCIGDAKFEYFYSLANSGERLAKAGLCAKSFAYPDDLGLDEKYHLKAEEQAENKQNQQRPNAKQ